MDTVQSNETQTGEQTLSLTPHQIAELQSGRACLRGTVQIKRAATGAIENYDIELRPLPQEHQENSNG